MNLRERQILQRYRQDIRDFQGANLRGLSDADFSFADIRGTNFSGANLTRAKFCEAKAGLQRVWLLVTIFCSSAFRTGILHKISI